MLGRGPTGEADEGETALDRPPPRGYPPAGTRPDRPPRTAAGPSTATPSVPSESRDGERLPRR